MVYRRHINTYVWHFSPDCSMWPTEEFEERQERPAHDPLDLCSECTVKLLKEGRSRPRRPNGK